MGDVVGVFARNVPADDADAGADDGDVAVAFVVSDAAACVVARGDWARFLVVHAASNLVCHGCAALLGVARRAGLLAYEATLELVHANRLHDVGIDDALLRLARVDALPESRALAVLLVEVCE